MEIYNRDMILTQDTSPAIVRYLEQCGYHPAELAMMNNVVLINAYHKEGWTRTPRPSDVQRAATQAMLDTLASIPQGSFPDEELVRYLARDEAQRIIANAAPSRLEIVTPTHTVMLNHRVHYRTPLVIHVASLGDDIMLVGPAGCGKTTIGEHVAQALVLQFYITSTVNESHELTGFVDGYGKYHSTPFRKAFEHGGVWIGDEIDAWDANALLTVNSALANGFCTFPDSDEPIRRHASFKAVTTANTFGMGGDRVYVGRNELDAASLDRFAVIDVDYDLDLERMFAGPNDAWLERVWNVRKCVKDKRIRHVVSSRAIAKGARALASGIDWKVVEELYMFKGMSEKDRSKIDD